MKMMAAFMALLVGAPMAQAQTDDQAVMLQGLSLPNFVRAYNGHAKFDNEPLIDFQTCGQRLIPNSKQKTFTCKLGADSIVWGTVYANDTIRQVLLDANPTDADALHRYRRATGYLVRSVKGGSILGVGTMAEDLLVKALKQTHKVNRYGLKFMAARDEKLGWTFGAERSE